MNLISRLLSIPGGSGRFAALVAVATPIPSAQPSNVLVPVPVEVPAIPTPGLLGTGNPFLDGLWFVLGLVLIWSFFYFLIYPRLLPHFGEGGSRAIFWPAVFLYMVTWLHLSSYLIFTYGFYFLWLRWSALALVGLLSLWFLLSFARRG
jgi:hypothetical protein